MVQTRVHSGGQMPSIIHPVATVAVIHIAILFLVPQKTEHIPADRNPFSFSNVCLFRIRAEDATLHAPFYAFFLLSSSLSYTQYAQWSVLWYRCSDSSGSQLNNNMFSMQDSLRNLWFSVPSTPRASVQLSYFLLWSRLIGLSLY